MASVSTSNESNIVKCREFEGYKGKIYDDEKENFVDQIFEMVKSRPADCTLTAEKKTLKAHKVILSAASNYLKVSSQLCQLILADALYDSRKFSTWTRRVTLHGC